MFNFARAVWSGDQTAFLIYAQKTEYLPMQFYSAFRFPSILATFVFIMKKYELLRINKGLLKVMSYNDIKVSDVSFIEIYDDFVDLRKELKFSATITELSIKYHKSERTISRMIAKLQEEATLECHF